MMEGFGFSISRLIIVATLICKSYYCLSSDGFDVTKDHFKNRTQENDVHFGIADDSTLSTYGESITTETMTYDSGRGSPEHTSSFDPIIETRSTEIISTTESILYESSTNMNNLERGRLYVNAGPYGQESYTTEVSTVDRGTNAMTTATAIQESTFGTGSTETNGGVVSVESGFSENIMSVIPNDSVITPILESHTTTHGPMTYSSPRLLYSSQHSLNAQLVSIDIGGNYSHFFVNVDENSALFRLGVSDLNNFLAIGIQSLSDVSGEDVVVLMSQLRSDEVFELLVRSTDIPNQCGFKRDLNCYIAILNQPNDQFVYTYIRGVLTEDATSPSNYSHRRSRKRKQYRFQLGPIGSLEDSFNHATDWLDHGNLGYPGPAGGGLPSWPANHRSNDAPNALGLIAARLDLISSSGSSSSFKYPGRRVRLCSSAPPQVCACQVGTSVTTCCPPSASKWFIQVPVYKLQSSTFRLFYKTYTSSYYLRGKSNHTTVSSTKSARLAVLGAGDCSAFQYRPRAIVSSAHLLALECVNSPRYFLKLLQCSDTEPDVVVEKDTHRYDDLLEGTRIHVHADDVFDDIGISDACLG